MIRDILAVIRLELKRLKVRITDFFRMFGVDPDTSLVYRLYIAAFALFWLFAMWAFVVEQVYLLSVDVKPEQATAVLEILPFGVAVGGLIYLIALFRNPPLKLIAPDMLYIATSPVSRGVVTFAGFIKAIVIPAGIISLVGALLAMLFAWVFDLPDTGLQGLAGMAVAFTLTLFFAMTCWALALLKQNQRSRRRNLWFWLILPAILLVASIFPDVMVVPGRIWVDMLRGEMTTSSSRLLIAGCLISFIALVSAGEKIHMTGVIADSQNYARIQKLGFWGRIMYADIVAGIQTQSRLSQRRVVRSRLPTGFTGWRAVFGYSYLSLWRLSPGILFRLVSMGMMIPSVIIALLTFSGVSLQMWLLILIFAVQMRPNDLTRTFREQSSHAHLRQYMPFNNLSIFIAAIALPLALIGLGGAIAIFAQTVANPIAAFLLTISLLITAALCQVIETVRLPAHVLSGLQYEYGILLAGTTVILAWHVSSSLWGALVVSVAINAFLSWMLSVSYSRV